MLYRKKPEKFSPSVLPPDEDGKNSAQLKPFVPLATNEDISSKKPRNKSPLSVMQESAPIPKSMTSLGKLNFYAAHTQQQKLLQKLVVDSILNGENSSLYWNEYTKEISAYLSSLTPIDSSDSVSPSLNSYVQKLDASSWFSGKRVSIENKNSLAISCASSTVSLLGFTDCENTKNKLVLNFKKKPRHQTSKMTPNSLSKVRLYPSKELHTVWKRWLAAYRWIYNHTIATLKQGYQGSCFDLQKSVRNSDKPEWVKSLPGHQLQEAVADAFDAFKQAKANKGKAKFKSSKAPSQIIKFKVNNFKNGTWYPRLTNGLTFTSPQTIPKNCPYGTQLKYARGKWYGCFPEYQDKQITDKERVIALDPGIRSFLVGYDGESIVELATNDIGKINRLCYHLDILMSKISKCHVKRKRYRMRKASHRMRERIRNLVDDLHKKVSHFLVNHYKLIFLPTFNSSDMVLKSRRKLNSKSVRNLLTWSHYRFSNHLMQQAERKGVLVVRCNESYTSKTCPHCGKIHEKLGGSKVFKCPNCGYTAPRDWVGARNIMLRALQATAVVFQDNAIVFQAA